MKISLEEAIKMLPQGKERVRTLRQLKNCNNYIAQADYTKKFLISLMKRCAIYQTGKIAKKMGFGLAIQDENGKLFIETLS